MVAVKAFLLQALQEAMPLADLAGTGSFTFPAFLGPSSSHVLPQQSFMDSESLILSQQRKLDAILLQKEQEASPLWSLVVSLSATSLHYLSSHTNTSLSVPVHLQIE